jgi:hypothetical protein
MCHKVPAADAIPQIRNRRHRVRGMNAGHRQRYQDGSEQPVSHFDHPLFEALRHDNRDR